jgi:hypothetical protein
VKTLLILYPIQPYADSLTFKKKGGLPEANERYAEIYQELVRKRYPDFQMVYVMFSVPGDLDQPDMSQLWKGFSVNEKDIIGACGVTFKDHCGKHIYPKTSKILGLCPCSTEELVVGGFHLWDCVDKVAKYAHEQDFNVVVDEDLTELFFFSVRGPAGIPMSRIPVSREESLRQMRRQLREVGRDFLLENALKERKMRPWMAQI